MFEFSDKQAPCYLIIKLRQILEKPATTKDTLKVNNITFAG